MLKSLNTNQSFLKTINDCVWLSRDKMFFKWVNLKESITKMSEIMTLFIPVFFPMDRLFTRFSFDIFFLVHRDHWHLFELVRKLVWLAFDISHSHSRAQWLIPVYSILFLAVVESPSRKNEVYKGYVCYIRALVRVRDLVYNDSNLEQYVVSHVFWTCIKSDKNISLPK